MQLLFDFLPIIAFFVAYKLADVYVATGAMLVILVAAMAFQWFRHRKIGPMLLVNGAIGLVFGGLTIWLRDETFVQWKPTVVCWFLAAALLIGSWVSDRPVIQRLLDGTLPLPPDAWRTLNLIWIGGFTVIGAVNLIVVYNVDLDTWVNFKLYGLTGLTLLFALVQGFWMAGKLPPETESPPQDSE